MRHVISEGETEAMIQVPVYNMEGELLSHVELDEAVLGGKVNWDVLRQAVIAYEANRRQGTAKTKTRGEVSYSDRKPWPQKHTGRARAGSRASPIWVGGGVVHGPRPRHYFQKLNRKMRCKALASALLAKLQAGQVKVLDSLQLREPKTRQVARILKNLRVERSFLVVVPAYDELLWRCTQNIRGAAMSSARELNAYEVLRAHELVFTREALKQYLGAKRDSGPAAGQPAPDAASK